MQTATWATKDSLGKSAQAPVSQFNLRLLLLSNWQTKTLARHCWYWYYHSSFPEIMKFYTYVRTRILKYSNGPIYAKLTHGSRRGKNVPRVLRTVSFRERNLPEPHILSVSLTCPWLPTLDLCVFVFRLPCLVQNFLDKRRSGH